MYYKISHGSVTLGNNTVLEDINFCVKDNEKIGIVGRNGSGKTTLLKAIASEYEINSGYEEVDIISSGDFNIGYVKQNDGYSLDMKMIDYIRSSFKDILDIEERALITSEYKDISVNDMHIMEAIGIQEPKNMSTVAKAVSVTTGTLTIAINHLVKKGYVERTRSEEDRRVVLVSLSEKGEKAFLHHLNPKETKDLTRALLKLQNFFDSYGNKEKN